MSIEKLEDLVGRVPRDGLPQHCMDCGRRSCEAYGDIDITYGPDPYVDAHKLEWLCKDCRQRHANAPAGDLHECDVCRAADERLMVGETALALGCARQLLSVAAGEIDYASIPYQFEMNGDSTPVWICVSCARASAEDV